ncbi:hypothetical protein GOP47_0013602 [Adiantum capillus-veneris]|uniref:Uncharacterized protein n=1 Tax=Adiantum capillus-veneris TaxID=13818 RepID=A0A9D4ZFX8_ADICA|nr:hypothetical protein GOP47_0013602 [Adiantum capillus-veneris]
MGAVIPGDESEYRRTYIRKVQRGDVIALPPRAPFTGGIMTAMSVTVFYALEIPATEQTLGAFM